MKSSPKILNCSENNEIFVGGCFLAAPCINNPLYYVHSALNVTSKYRPNGLLDASPMQVRPPYIHIHVIIEHDRVHNVRRRIVDSFYRAMHYSAKRGLAVTSRLSVYPSVCDVGRS